MAKNGISRRHFLFGSLLTAAIPVGGFGTVPSLKFMGYVSPNEKLNIGCIGAGGRAASDIRGVSTQNIVALADPDSVRAARMFKAFPNVPKFKDFRRMFDQMGDQIDAVTIAIPDFMHGTAAMWAMERGKHVYCEKPLTHTPWEARMLTQAAERYKVATQMGNQGYSNDGTRIAAEIIWSGAIGDVTEVHAWTNRPEWPQGFDRIPPAQPVPDTLDWDVWLGIAAERDYTGGDAVYRKDEHTGSGFYQPFKWRGFLDLGCGPVGDMACHILGPANMALLLGAPTSVETIKRVGTNSLTYPSQTVTRFEFPARKNMGPVTVYWYDAQTGPAYWPPDIPHDQFLIGGPGAFGDGPPNSGEGVLPPEPGAPSTKPSPAPAARKSAPPSAESVMRAENRNGTVFVGTKGYLTTDTYGSKVRLLPESKYRGYTLPPEILTRSPGHYAEWIGACKGGVRASSDFRISGPFTEWVLLATIAMRVPGKLEWDSANLRFTNSDEANKYIMPNFRKPWSDVWNGKKLESVAEADQSCPVAPY